MSSLTPSPQKNSRQKKAGKNKHTISTAIEQGALMGVRDYIETQRRNNLKNNKSGSKRLASDNDSGTKSKRPKRTPKQVNYDIKLAKANKADNDSRYKEALKEGTKMYTDGQDPTSEVKKISLRGVCDEMNTKHELNGGKKKLNKTSLERYVNDHKIVGGSPLKTGPKPKLPLPFWDLLNCHVTMLQLEGKAEAKSGLMKALIAVCIKNTDWADMNINYIYAEFRQKFPETVTPTCKLDVEARRGIWTTYPNINIWFSGAKKILIQYGFVEDKPQRVVDIFRGRNMPCDIDRKFCDYDNIFPS